MFYIYADGVSIYDPSNPAYLLFEPKLTVEFGKAGSLEFSIPKSNVYYNSLHQLKTVVSVTIDGVEIFRGRVLNYSTDFRNFKQVYCEGNLSYLVDSVQKGEKYEGTTHALFRKIIAAHNSRVEAYKQFTVGNITIEDRPVSLTGRDENPDESETINYKQIAINSITDEWNNSFDYIQTCLIDYCGGYLKTRRVGNTTYIDLLASYTGTAAQEVEFGVNLLDLRQEISEEDLFTVLIPLGDDNLTVASVNGGSDEIVDRAAVSEYGRIVRTQVFSNVTSASTLLENGQRYLAEHTNVPVSITVNAVDLHLVDSSIAALQVGQRVHINSSPHNVVEYLTCTKIEYDLSNPENTSYTFGNPKQTLTQRYREDKRAQSDTYGNGAESSGSSGYASASGIGAVGSVQAAEAEKTKKEIKDDIYEEWIKIDPDNPDGVGSIGGLYRLVKDHQRILQTVGVNFDAEAGNVNLKALAQRVDENTGKIDLAEAKTEETATIIDGKLTAISKTVASVQTELGTKSAEWEVFANETESAIRGKADKFDVEAIQSTIHGEFEKTNGRFDVLKSVGIDVDAQTGNINIRSLTQRVDENERMINENRAEIRTQTSDLLSRVQLVASTASENKKNIASVTATATQLGSYLTLKADKTTVDGDLNVIHGQLTALEGEIDVLKARKITADEVSAALAIMDRVAVRNLTASTISSPSINISDTDGGGVYPVASRAYVDGAVNKIGTGGNHHSHEISVADDGTVTFGYATSTPQSFNVTATRAYRNGVAAAQRAVKINELDRDEHFTDTYNSTTHATTVHLQAITEYGQTKGANIVVSGTKAYQDGYSDGATEAADAAYQRGFDDVDFDRLVVNVSGITFPYDSSRETYNIRIPYTAYLENSNDYTGAITADITSFYNSSYNSGRNGVTIRSLVRDPNQADSYNSSTHKTTVHVIATASNNNTLSGSIITGTEAYDDGHSAGYSLGQTTGKNSVKVESVDITESHSIANKKITVSSVARLSNGKTGSNTKEISTESHYNAGVNSVTISSLVFGTPSHDTTNKTVTVSVTATPSNDVNGNKKTTKSITIPTTSHYNAGVSSVTLSSVTISDSHSVGNKYIDITAVGKASNGSSLTEKKRVSTVDHYNAGFNAVTLPTANFTFDSIVHDTANKKVKVTAKAILSNNSSSLNRTYTKTNEISTASHYNAGQNSVTISSVVGRKAAEYVGDDGWRYVSTSHKMMFYYRATASNGKTYDGYVTSGTDAYDAGKNSVTISSVVGRKAADYVGDDGWRYVSTSHKMMFYYRATASNGKTYDSYVTSGTEAYDDGKATVFNSIAYSSSGYETDEYGSTDYDHIWVRLSTANGNKMIANVPSKYDDGVDSVSISGISYGTYSEDGSPDYGHVNISLSNGNSKYTSISPNAYNEGWTAGYNRGRESLSYATFKIVGVNTSSYEVLVSCTTWGSMAWLSIGDTFDQT